MIYLLYTVHIVVCIFLILVVLLQQGKGADLSMFAGGSTQAAFGARGAATLLHKLTVAFFVLFIMTTLSIGIMQRGASSSSIMSGLDPEPAAAVADEEEAVSEPFDEADPLGLSTESTEDEAPSADEAPADEPGPAEDEN